MSQCQEIFYQEWSVQLFEKEKKVPVHANQETVSLSYHSIVVVCCVVVDFVVIIVVDHSSGQSKSSVQRP